MRRSRLLAVTRVGWSVALLMAIPLFVMVIFALKTDAAFAATPLALIFMFVGGSLVALLGSGGVLHSLVNSVCKATRATASCLALAFPTARPPSQPSALDDPVWHVSSSR